MEACVPSLKPVGSKKKVAALLRTVVQLLENATPSLLILIRRIGVRRAVTERHELVVEETDPHLLRGGVEAVRWSGELWEGRRRLWRCVQPGQI